MESSNHSIRDHVNRMAVAEPQTPVVQRVVSAAFHKNTSRGHHKASSLELLFDQVPKFLTACNPDKRGSVEDNIAETQRRQLMAALSTKIRSTPTVRVGDNVNFWRGNKVRTTSGSVVETDGRVVQIKHNELIEYADLYKGRQAPRDGCNSDDDSSQNTDSLPSGSDANRNSSKIINIPTIPAVKTSQNRITQA